MKKSVLVFGLVSGALAVAVMALTVRRLAAHDYRTADVLGYSALVVSALLVFFGIRSYRESAGGGKLAFGRGVLVGVLITLVSSLCYAAAFQAAYFGLVPNLGETYAACMVDRVRQAGGSAEAVEAMARRAALLKRLWDRPLTNAAVSLAESLPLGLAAALVSAAILRRKAVDPR